MNSLNSDLLLLITDWLSDKQSIRFLRQCCNVNYKYVLKGRVHCEDITIYKNCIINRLLYDGAFPLYNIPTTVSTFTIHAPFNTSMVDLPDSITSMHLNKIENSKRTMQITKWPKEVKFFSVGAGAYKWICTWPQTLEMIQFGNNFNKPYMTLPDTVHTIIFGNMYNQPISVYPKSLQSITFGQDFNQSIDNLPDTVHTIVLGNSYNMPIAKYPSSLRSITFGKYFNQPVIDLPDTVTYLKVEDIFEGPITKWPKAIKSLSVGEKFSGGLPPYLDILECSFLNIKKLELTLCTKNTETITMKSLSCNKLLFKFNDRIK